MSIAEWAPDKECITTLRIIQMNIDTDEALGQIKELLDGLEVRKVVHKFASGCKIVDIWHGDKFYVVQIEPERMGLSLVVSDGDLNTEPDEKYFDVDIAIKRLKAVLK